MRTSREAMFTSEWGKNPAELLRSDEEETLLRDEEHGWAFQKAQEVLAKNAMDRFEFTDRFGANVIDADSRKVEALQARFERSDKNEGTAIMTEKATILQAMVHEYGARWLGDPKATFYRTDPFDDYLSGVDEVVSFPRGASREEIGMNIDVTFSKSLEEKIEGIVDSIRNGHLPRVKYFPGRGDIVVPKVILGTNRSKMLKMQHAWVRPRADLGHHAFRHFMFEELLFQTEAFMRYAMASSQPGVAATYQRAYEYLSAQQRVVGPPSAEVQQEIDEDVMVQNLKAVVKNAVRPR